MEAIVHRLYERAVQSPELDLAFLEKAYARHVGGEPETLREDFCGTALMSARWVESDPDREALGVDLDPAVLARAGDHGLDEEERERLELRCEDVRWRSPRAYDLVVAMNFSWAVLDDAALDEYLATARACCDGLFALELFGGEGLTVPGRTEHALDGFTYVWTQRAFDGRHLDATLSFALDDGPRFDDAFRYRFVLRPIDELRRRLRDAGFAEAALYVEDARGRRIRRKGPPRAPLWRGYLLAW